MRYLFVDCRWDIGDPKAGRRGYLEAHIPGAAFLDVERDLSAPAGRGGRHPLPTDEQFAAAASRAGISSGVFVVAYGNMGGAERLWWLLRHFGHDECAVIDFAGWRGPLRGGEENVEPAEFVARPRMDDTIEAEELAERLGELVVVDARVPARWRGEPNPIDKVPGRIPGALKCTVERAAPGAAGGRARRLLRLGRHRLRAAAPARAGGTSWKALSRLVVGVGAAPGAPGRAGLTDREDDADARGDLGGAGLDRRRGLPRRQGVEHDRADALRALAQRTDLAQ